MGRPCAQKEFGVGFPKGEYGFKAVQRFELFCQLFSLRLSVEPAGSYNRKIHYLTREFRVKLHLKTDIGFRVQFNAEFTSQVMNFP